MWISIKKWISHSILCWLSGFFVAGQICTVHTEQINWSQLPVYPTVTHLESKILEHIFRVAYHIVLNLPLIHIRISSGKKHWLWVNIQWWIMIFSPTTLFLLVKKKIMTKNDRSPKLLTNIGGKRSFITTHVLPWDSFKKLFLPDKIKDSDHPGFPAPKPLSVQPGLTSTRGTIHQPVPSLVSSHPGKHHLVAPGGIHGAVASATVSQRTGESSWLMWQRGQGQEREGPLELGLRSPGKVGELKRDSHR